MARRTAAALAALLLALFSVGSCALPARAQSLQRLTVDSFTLSADTKQPAIEVPFHLVISLHVRQQVAEIDHLNLPILAELELQGDERRLQAGPGGTQYRELITVVAHHTGTISIAPATLQAIDARDGRAKQYYTNALSLVVTGGSLEPIENGDSFAVAALHAVVTAGLWTVGIVVAIVVLALVVRRRVRPATVPAAAPAPPPPPPPQASARSQRDVVSDALAVLRADPARQTAIVVRSALWRMVGAPDGETLGDVLRRISPADARMRDVLSALERAAFTYDADLNAAIPAACDALERYLA
ncbi:MAG: hypothetical protein JO199_07530 [Candidatus Eremiobacteraeota bacterium]|nr:hypothetical protein [Candidatus Eremiobacteraeota bacterium]